MSQNDAPAVRLRKKKSLNPMQRFPIHDTSEGESRVRRKKYHKVK